MEYFILENDIKVFYVMADSFPNGVGEAHHRLHSLLPTTINRRFFAISHPNTEGKIVYKAAVEESYDGEAEKLNCKTFTICSGKFISETIKDWQKDESLVGRTFAKLLAHPDINHLDGYCLEEYLDEITMRCSVGLNSKK